MTGDDKETLAAEFVLGTLDPETRALVESYLTADPQLQAAVDDWEQRLAPLGDGLEPVEPSAGLWQSIESALDVAEEQLPGTTTLRAEEGDWQTIAEGVEVKLLTRDEDKGTQSVLMRMAPGSSLPRHAHRKAEECYVIEGSIDLGRKHLVAGDFHLAPAGIEHPASTSRTGVLVFISSEIHEFAA